MENKAKIATNSPTLIGEIEALNEMASWVDVSAHYDVDWTWSNFGPYRRTVRMRACLERMGLHMKAICSQAD